MSQTEHTVAWGLITLAPLGEDLSSQDEKLLFPQGPGFRPLLALPSIFLVLDKELHFFSRYQGIRKSIGSPWFPIPVAEDTIYLSHRARKN